MQPQTAIEKTGRIIRIVSGRGFAFVNADDGNGDYFLHLSQYTGDFSALKEGDRVRFEPINGEKGPRAHNAIKVGGNS